MPRPPQPVLVRHVQAFLKSHKVQNGKILVAVSGGPDSIALLQALYELSPARNLTLLVGHYNHALRTTASDGDAEFVRHFCAKRSIHCLIQKELQPALTHGQSHLEAQARRLRYGWLTKAVHEHHCQWLITGHTMNDQAETVLHHILRGTGLRGLRGIAPKRRLPLERNPRSQPEAQAKDTNPKCSEGTPARSASEGASLLLRPLLQTTRDEVLSFLASRSITPRHDSSNLDLRFTRNRIRHQVLPLITEFLNPQAIRHLAQWADVARANYYWLRKQSAKLLRLATLPSAGHMRILKKPMLASSKADILQEALLQLWRQSGWSRGQMNAARWRDLMEVCRGKHPQVQLPDGILARQVLQVVQIGPVSTATGQSQS